MPRLVTKFKYMKPGSGGKSAGGYARYIATREGVERIDDSHRHAPATQKQQTLIAKLLRDFPEAKTSHEYQDYMVNQTVGNASEFITQVIEENMESIADTRTYADYIATRPRAERFGSHGLFTDDGVQVQLEKVSAELNQYTGHIYTSILSLRREDAARLGFDTGSRWRDFLRSQTPTLAENLKIPLEHLRWYAAYHNEGHHPHVHLIAYSSVPGEGYLSEQGVEKLRSAFARDIFSQDLICTYEQQSEYRDQLRQQGRERVAQIVEQINAGEYRNERVEELLRTLSIRLAHTSGKKQYGYLKPELKDMVDQIVMELAGDENIRQLYDLWYEQREDILRTYTDTFPERIPLEQNKEFKSIRNAVIQDAMKIVEEIQQSASMEPYQDVPEIGLPRGEEPKEGSIIDPEYWRSRIPSVSAENPVSEEGQKPPQEDRIDDRLLYRLAAMCLSGSAAGMDFEQARRYFEAAAVQGNADALYGLGKLYLRKDYERFDPAKALEYLEQSAVMDHAFAKYQLGKDAQGGKQPAANGKPLPQGIVLGCAGKTGTTALVDTDDVHCLMIGASGVGKTAYFLYPNLEYACASGMSFLALDTKGDLARNYGAIARDIYGYHISIVDLREPTRSDGNNLLTLINRYMDIVREEPRNINARAKAEKYAKILAKTIINPEGDGADHGQNAYFYDAAEGLLASVILLLAEFLPPEETDGYEMRHIASVFKLVQELMMQSSSRRGGNQFQELMQLLPGDHKAKWLAGSALTASDQAMNSVMSTVLSKLNAFLDSELEQVICFDGDIDAELFANEKSAIFLILPEEDATKNFVASLMIQNLTRELFAVANENGGKLQNRAVFFCDELGTMPPFDILPLFSAGRSRRLTLVPIIQSLAQLVKNYGSEGAEIIQDNCQDTIFGGFAPNSQTAETLSKNLGSRTVLSGQITRGKDNTSQSLQMMERPLLTPDELKSMPKGSFVVMKTGSHPMRTKLKLFLDWGIRFGEPLQMPERGTRPVYYAGRRDLERAILCVYPPMRTMEAAVNSAITERPMPHLATPAKLNLEDE